MSIIEQIERRTNRAFAEMTGRTLIEDMTPTEQKAALEDDIEQKVRYVRTPAGVRRFGQPIGSIIVRDVVGSLGRIRVKNPVFKGFELVEDKKGNLYDVGKDDTNGKYVALKHNTWDDQIEPADSLDDALKALNDKLGGGSSDEGEKPAPKAKKTPSKAPAPKEEPKESAAAAKAREDALGIRNAMTATNGRIDGHEKALSALLEKNTTKAQRDAMKLHGELITEIEDQTRAAKNLKRNRATPQDVKDMMDLVIESEAGRKERATKARDAATKYAPKPKTSAPEKPSQSTNKAVTKDTPIGTPVRVTREYDYPGKTNSGMAGAVGTITRRNKNGVTVSSRGGIATVPYDALEVISKADLERSKKAAGASKDMDLLSKQEGHLRDSMGRMEKASTLEKLEELNHDFTVQRARQITKAREIIKNPRTSDEDRKRAESIKGRLEAMDDDELALYERKKKELSAPAKSKGGSIGARGSKERDAFIAAHPKLKDVNDYHKPKIRDLDEKNFQAYLTAVEGGKSPDSIGAIMSRVAPGISWNPITEKWSGQGSTKRPTSPTPTDTSASDAADRATREAVEKMKGEGRAKGRKNPYTSALTGTQQNAVNDLTPGEYATYMNARDGGSGHHEAMRKAKPAQGRTPLQEGRDTMRMHENASVERKPMMRLQNSFKVAAKKLQEDPDKVKRIRDNRLNTMEQSIKDRESRLADPRYSGALLDRDREAFTSNIERDKKILADVRKKIDAMSDESARERATDDFFGTTGLPKQSEADKGAERTLKFAKDARAQAGGIKVGPDLQRNIIKHRTALEGIEEAQERIRLSSRGLSDDMKGRVKQERENLDTHRDMLRRKIKGFEDQIQEDQDVDTRMRENRKKREAVGAQSRKFGNTNIFLAENDDLLRTIVRLGRSDKGDPSQLLPDVRQRLAEINNRLSWTDDELGGYHKGAGREMSDTAAARHRAGLTDQKSKFETAEKLIDGRKPAPSAQDQPNDTMKMHQRASDARKPFVREENSFTAYTNMVEQGKVRTKRHGRTIIKTMEDSIARREERMKDSSMTDDLLPRDVQARKDNIKTDKRRLEASRKIVDKMPEDKPTAPYVPDSQKPSSSDASSPVSLADVKWTKDDSKKTSYIKSYVSATVNGRDVEIRQEGDLNTYVVSVKDSDGTEVFKGGFDSREFQRTDVRNIAVRAANGEDPMDPRPAGSPSDQAMTPLEQAKANLWAYDAKPTEGVDPGMQSMRFHESQRQRNKKMTTWLNQMKRESAERDRLKAAVSAARKAQVDAATPKTPVAPEMIKGADAVLILNRGRAEWNRVKRVNRTTVTVDGGGGGMDDPKYPHGKVVGIRKDGQVTLGGQEQAATPGQDNARANLTGGGASTPEPFRRRLDIGNNVIMERNGQREPGRVTGLGPGYARVTFADGTTKDYDPTNGVPLDGQGPNIRKRTSEEGPLNAQERAQEEAVNALARQRGEALREAREAMDAVAFSDSSPEGEARLQAAWDKIKEAEQESNEVIREMDSLKLTNTQRSRLSNTDLSTSGRNSTAGLLLQRLNGIQNRRAPIVKEERERRLKEAEAAGDTLTAIATTKELEAAEMSNALGQSARRQEIKRKWDRRRDQIRKAAEQRTAQPEPRQATDSKPVPNKPQERPVSRPAGQSAPRPFHRTAKGKEYLDTERTPQAQERERFQRNLSRILDRLPTVQDDDAENLAEIRPEDAPSVSALSAEINALKALRKQFSGRTLLQEGYAEEVDDYIKALQKLILAREKYESAERAEFESANTPLF